ncbi:rhodanese-like domain-containing protein [Psychromonas aquatilis]|uniref:Rhodanese-like domain-containing protein n=1 Tax=Psychromonas aquatilis TaxID=2005072 RepID=A0ABU9GM70_9GAMM
MLLDGKGLVEQLRPQVTEVTCETVAQLISEQSPILFIDIREPQETKLGTAIGSETVPRGVLEMKLANLPRYQALLKKSVAAEELPIYLLCRSGARSVLAAASLQSMGYKNVYSVAGGYLDWQTKGLSTQGG